MKIEKTNIAIMVWAVAASLLVSCSPAHAVDCAKLLALPDVNAVTCSIYKDCRYEEQPMRNARGDYTRPTKTYEAFVCLHHCPSTGSDDYRAGCPGWAINHSIPRACGGRHAVWNMEWLPYDIKHAIGSHAIDSFERKINAFNPPKIDTPTCRNQIVK